MKCIPDTFALEKLRTALMHVADNCRHCPIVDTRLQ